jgi:hypothetical protein
MKQRTLTKTNGHFAIRDARAIDGDTIEAVILLPFGAMTSKRIRLKGWWAPEMYGRLARSAWLAKHCLQEFLDANECSIFSRSERTDRYGRVIADLFSGSECVHAYQVIGMQALTEELHKQDVDWKRSNPDYHDRGGEPEDPPRGGGEVGNGNCPDAIDDNRYGPAAL